MRQTLLLIGILCTTLNLAHAQSNIDQGLVTYYPLNGNPEDMSGQKNTGILEGAKVVDGRFGEAYRFDGDDALWTAQVRQAPDIFTVAMWFKAEAGGQLIGFGKSQEGPSSANDRNLILSDDGRLYWGMYGGNGGVVSTPRSYTDGEWHHVVAALSEEGARLYVDGEQAAHDPKITQGFPYRGYWRIAAGTVGNWMGARPVNTHVTGTLDEVRIYKRALSEAEAKALYAYDPTRAAMTPRERVEEIVEVKLQQWSQRGKFEKTEDYEARVNEDRRAAARDSLTQQALAQVGEDLIDWNTARNSYDPDKETFTIRVDGLEPFELAVPIGEAETLDKNFRETQYLDPVYGLGDGGDLSVEYVEIVTPGGEQTYVYDRDEV